MKILYLLAVVILFISSCKKAIEIGQPINEIQSTVVFSNDSTAQSAVTGLYSIMMQFNGFMMNGGATIYGGLAADELKPNNTSPDYEGYYSGSLNPTHSSLLSRLWQVAYSGIYQANQVIEGLKASTGVSASLRQQLTGEALFVRAFYYFHLVNFFGAVPLVTSTDYRQNSILPRADSARVYSQIVSDLKGAKNLLTALYTGAGRVRPQQLAASALLARVYLYQQEWAKSVEESSLVIQSPQYSLVTNLNNVFIIGSTETIWQLMPGTTQANTGEGSIFIPFSTTAIPQLSLTPSLFNSFEAGDQRKINWVKSVTGNTINYPYPFKYKVRTGATAEYYVVLRLAEQLLIRAEANARLQQLNLAKADLDKVRARASLPVNSSTDQAGLLDAIFQERRIELFAEWSHRWFDLKRTGRSTLVLGPLKPLWHPLHVLFPIPQQELDRNYFLVQNPGY